ncbi:M3 family metallopeptidase [Roseateles asaccharophilus]|uniref:Thimet oligopeptidase n=1 Tax=Roseateles asaccharophilus TaxID=582607 RepID=A0ABU2A6K4_9BURK|nr:M3 family metallopeptidase [Roseateles asaccharophilus]MDR7331668.1 thimet oligopeptidase [Roseateles asaccharophilus]
MKTALTTLASLLLAATAQAQPKLPGPNFPTYNSVADVQTRCDAGLKGAKQRVTQLEKRKVDAGWLAALDDLTVYFEDHQYPNDFILNVHPVKAIRDAAQACSLRWADFSSSLGQNEKLFRALQKAPKKDGIDAEFVRLASGQFEDTGVALPKAKRERAKQILDKLTELDQQFNKNIRDAGTRVAFTEAELKGVPASVWEKAKRDEQGRIVLGVDYPSYVPVMRSAESEAARQRMWLAKTNEGGQPNLDLLAQIVTLRGEYAKLFGFDNYVDFNLRRRMAKDGATATKFLDSVTGAVNAREKTELQELRAAKAQHVGTALDATTVQRWDATFYGERLKREKFSVDQNAFRPYFPPQASLEFSMKIIEQLMGVKYQRVDNTLWHDEVQTYVVSDAASGQPIAQMYVDLYPRDGKYNHAAVWPLRGSATRAGRTPAAALVVNFDRQGLTLDEVETLLHELGHAVHVNLSKTRYAATAGTAVMHDFVEAPSQMLEDWVYDKNVLKLMQAVCADCKPVPDAMVAQAQAAKHYGKGGQFGRQHLYASYDITLHQQAKPEPLPLWAKMEGATPLGHVKDTKFPAGFAHIAGGYGAGYYGYLWSLVVAMDLRTAFEKDKLGADAGKRYRDAVLGQGAQKPAPELVKDFLGRESNSQAFFEYLKK